MPDDSQDKTRTEGRGTGSNSNDSTPMKRLGDFELLREIGRGGMGVVYEARQTSLNRRVALKVLPPGLGLTGKAVQRFQREAQAAAKLHHTNIVPVYAIGEADGCHYYAMELVEGQALSDVLKDLTGSGSNPLMDATVTRMGGAEDKPVPDPTVSSPSLGASAITSFSDTSSGSRKWFDVVAKLVSEVADALGYAHGRGVIHRDIKPANLMLSGEGRLFITDFGLARVAQEPGMTVSGSLMGTPAYMSPEQIASGRMKLDHRTDVYSLGAVLYEMLTHQRPFPGDNREEILGGILTKDPRPPRRFNPRIPVDLETICLKAMEKDPDKRYATAGELAEDLRQYLVHGLIKARRAGIIKRAWKSVRRHPVLAISVLAAVLVLVTGGSAWRFAALHSEEEARRAISDARYHLRDGEYHKGLARIEEALREVPNSREGRFIKARILVAMYRHRDAADEASQLLEEDPEDWRAHLILAYAARYGVPTISAEEHMQAFDAHASDSAEAYLLRASLEDSPATAIKFLDRALEIDPSHHLALFHRWTRHRELKNLPAAMADAERMIAVRPQDALGRRALGMCYSIDLRDRNRGLEEFKKAVELDPDSSVNYMYLGRAYHWVGRNDDAIAEFTRGIEIEPTYSSTWVDRAAVYYRMERYEDAVADSMHVIELDPNSLSGYRWLFSSYWRLQDVDALRTAMEKLQKRMEEWTSEGQRASVHRSLSAWYRTLGDNEEALAHAERAIELSPESLSGYVQRIATLHRIEGDKGIEKDCDRLAAMEIENLWYESSRAKYLSGICKRPQRAIESWSLIIKRAPHWPDSYSSRGRLYQDRHEYEKALADYDHAIELAPQWAKAYRKRSLAYSGQKLYEKALADIKRAIELEPENSHAFENRAQVNLNLERFEEALSDLEQFFELSGNRGLNARWFQALALLRLGREEQALAATDRAIENYSNASLPIRRRALLLWLMGRTDEAQANAERAVQQSPNVAGNYVYRANAILLTPGGCKSALNDHVRARDLSADSAAVVAELSWQHSILVYRHCPDAYDPDLALHLARVAVDDNPEKDTRQLAMGMALYRLGRYHEARSALLGCADLRVPQPEPFELFALAMTEWKLGNRAEAHEFYDRGLARTNETYPRYLEYIMLREEAATLMRIEP